MDFLQKFKATQFIRPTASFSMQGDKIIWIDKNQMQPTNDEIEEGWVAYQAAQAAEIAAKAAAKAAAQAKLAALGLTVGDLQALGL